MMNILGLLRGQKGAALISTYIVGIISLIYSSAAYESAVYQAKAFERDTNKVHSFEAAEAGIQKAMQQIGVGAYTGTINSAAISSTTFQSVYGANVGSYSVSMTYNNADWVVITSTGTSGSSTTVLEGSVFLESPLSKFSIFITDSTTGGANLVLGTNDGMVDANGDGVDDTSRGVPENWIKRAKYYYGGDYTFGGTGISIYGDFNAQGSIAGYSSGTTEIYGDLYVGSYAENSSGAVTSTGITSNANRVNINDGFSDDEDRNASGSVTSADAPDIHDITASGAADANKTQTLPSVSTTWYSANNNITAFNTAGNRFLIFTDNGSGTATVVKNVTAAQYKSYVTTGSFTGTPTGTYTLPNKAVVYNNGSLYVTGNITGRVSVVSSNDIYFDGSGVAYYGNQRYASSSHSAAFIASDQIYVRGDSIRISGILFARNSSNSALGMDAGYVPNSSNYANSDADSSKSYLRFYGNTLIDGTLNTGVYSDRAWVWDSNLAKYRPPGIPVEPELRVVREVVSD